MAKRRPVVGVPACIKPIGAHDFHVVGRKYVDAVLAAGCTPILLPALGERQDVAQLIDMLNGVMFTGSAHAAKQGALQIRAKGEELDRYRAERLRMAAKLAALDN